MDFRDLFLTLSREPLPANRVLNDIAAIRESLRHTERALELLAGLRDSWQTQVPGKRGAYVFFVRDFELQEGHGSVPEVVWCDAFFARTFVNDLGRAEEGVGNHWAGPHQPKTPVPLGDYDEALHEECPRCGLPAMTVGKYWQEDAVFGDIWHLILYRLCPNCPCMERVAGYESGSPFSHRLRRPAG